MNIVKPSMRLISAALVLTVLVSCGTDGQGAALPSSAVDASISAAPSNTAAPTTAPPTATVPAATTQPQPIAAACTSDALLPVVAALFPENDRWDVLGVNIAECQGGYVRLTTVNNQSSCPSETPECFNNEQVFLKDVGGNWTYLDSGSGISCSDPQGFSTTAEACRTLGLSTLGNGSSPCPVVPPFVAMALPSGFSAELLPGSGAQVTIGGDGVAVPIEPIDTTVRHYAGEPGRFIDIYGQSMPAFGSATVETIEVLGTTGQFGAIEDGFKLEFPQACGTYSILAYGLTADAFKAVIASLTSID